ncbi:MAG: hypothetical protein IJX42_00385 [Oscillospiraceae bacterium]|nr:hypothetical protein [Oscillospiraceae bacterium]MBQ8377579.1 hypothetical protein [Oscillospiraceae bacterium]
MAEPIREFGWDDEISDEGSEFVLLPEGDYDFTVSKFERARHQGSEKMPPCNMAKVTFTIWGAEDKIEIVDNFYLCDKFEWKLSALFLSIGLKKRGEHLKMNWNLVTGAKGKCRVYVENYHKKDDKEGEKTGYSNKIKKFYAYDETVQTVQPNTVQPSTTPTYTAPPSNSGWKAGAF